MEKPFENRFESESSSEDDDSEKKKRKAKAKGIGAFARTSLDSGKRAEKSERESETSSKNEGELFGKNPKSESKDENKQSPKSNEKTDTPDVEAVKREIIKQQLESETEDLKATVESSEPGTPEHTEAVAVLAFTERLNQKLEKPTAETDPEIDMEFERRMAEIELEDFDSVEALVPETTSDNTGSIEEPAEDPDAPAQPPTTPPITNPANPTTSSNHTAPPSVPGSSIPPPSITPPSSPPPPPAMPPLPPTPAGPRGPAFGGGNFNAQPLVNNANIAPTPNIAPEKEVVKDHSSALLGGVVGYMIGRRGGRKRTERRLQPEINRLNKEVESTKRNLASKEQELRSAVRTQPREQSVTNRETTPSTQKRTPTAEILRRSVSAPEQIDSTLSPTGFEQQSEQTRGAVLEQIPLQSTPTRTEKVTAQVFSETLNKQKETTQPTKEQPLMTRHEKTKKVAELPTIELLKTAESIEINGTTARRLYETNQIDRKGLVHIVQEKMRGRSTEEAFESVELGRERQRERAREFRHDDPSFTAIASDDTTNTPPVETISDVTATNKPQVTTQKSTSFQPSPLNLSSEDNTETEHIQKPESESKQNYLAAGTIFAIGIALLIAWFLFSV